MPVSSRVQQRQRAFTLVELLVVIAIIGILVALLLPAVQQAREAARRNQCINNLKQLSLGALTHESSVKHLPTGGWGNDWVGDADRGFGQEQTGGWVFNILAFIEEAALRDQASDGKPDVHTQPQLQGAWNMLLHPISIISCPSRRSGGVYRAGGTASAKNAAPLSADTLVGRGDYGACVGDSPQGFDHGGPPSLQIVHLGFYTFRTERLGRMASEPGMTGVSFQRSEIAIKHIKDGTSKTYLYGENYLNPDNYLTGRDPGDNETWCTGANNDNFRSAFSAPQQDRPGVVFTNVFGSAHTSSFHMAWCDGHVTGLSYDIDVTVHRNNANRKDGNVNVQ